MNVLIADDDPLSLDLLTHFCGKMAPDARVTHAGDGAMAAAVLHTDRPALLFLDLEMPGMNGRELLQAMDPQVPVIIVTGDAGFAADSYRFNVVDYLLKPVAFERFAQAWRRAMERGHTRPSPTRDRDIVFVRTGSDIVRLDLGEVRFIRSDSNYVRFTLDGRELSSLMNLKDLEQKLPSQFVRVHRSYIVNLHHVEKLDTNDVKIGRELIPVSETYRAELIRRLDLL